MKTHLRKLAFRIMFLLYNKTVWTGQPDISKMALVRPKCFILPYRRNTERDARFGILELKIM